MHRLIVSSIAASVAANHTLYAQSGSGSGDSPITIFLPFVLIIVIFYFLLIRPQQKRQKELDRKKTDIKKGDVFITNGGLYARVDHFKKDGKVVVAEISKGVQVEIVRGMIADVIQKETNTEAAKIESAKSKPKSKA